MLFLSFGIDFVCNFYFRS